jgi:hypothetical protein
MATFTKTAVLVALALIPILLGPGASRAGEKRIVGWVERALIYPGDLILLAKVDTGAVNTSIDAANVTEVHRNGKLLLRFQVADRRGNTVTLEREQIGLETMTLHHGEVEERPLITLEICLGKDCRQTLVSLADRSGQKYPLLIGRSFLLDHVIVDPSREYTVEPTRADSVRP